MNPMTWRRLAPHPPETNVDDRHSGANAAGRAIASNSSRPRTQIHGIQEPLNYTAAGSSSLEQHNSDLPGEEFGCASLDPASESLQAADLPEFIPSVPSTDTASNTHSTASATSPPTSISQDDDLHDDSSTPEVRPTSGSTSAIEVIEICQGTFVAVTHEPCNEDKLQWRALRQRIHMAFAKTCRRYPNLSIQFKLAGKSAGHLQPVILFVCPPDTQKQVRKFLKKHKWLSEAECGYKSLIVDGNFLRVVWDGEDGLDGDLFIRTDVDDVQTLCAKLGRLESALNPDGPGSRFTIGGVILVNDTLCCLTTGHVLNDGPDTSEIASSSDEDESDEEDEQCYITDPLHLLPSTPAFDPQDHGNFEGGETHNQLPKETRIGKLLTTSNWKRGVLTSNEDWSLIRLDAASCRDENIVNKFYYPGTDGQDPVQITIDKLAHAEAETMETDVIILAGCTGLQKGRLNTTAVQLYLDNATFEAREIVTDEPLRTGDSGSWVVHGSKLLGHVFAIQEGTVWSYMVPITQVVDDIQKSLLAYSIELPTQKDQAKASLICARTGRSHASLVVFGINACPKCDQDLSSLENFQNQELPNRDCILEDRVPLDVDQESSSSFGDSYESSDHSDLEIEALTLPSSYPAVYGKDDLGPIEIIEKEILELLSKIKK